MPNAVDTQEVSKTKFTAAQRETGEHMFRRQSFSGRERHCLFLNQGEESFQTASHITGFDFPDDGRGLALTDWDNDGDLDLWLANRHGPQLRYLENQSTGTRWLSLKLTGDGRKVNRDAIGSVVTVYLKENGQTIPLRREVVAGAAFLSQSSLRLNYGLGTSDISHIIVRWPDGTSQKLPAPKLNRNYTLSYGQDSLREWKRPQLVSLPKFGLPEPDLIAPTHLTLVGNYPLPSLGLKDATGKPTSMPNKTTLVKFWASWCPDCHKDLSLLPEQLVTYKKAGISIALVNTETDKTPASPVTGLTSLYTGDKGLQLLQRYLDSHHIIQREIAFPLSVLLDAKGNVLTIYFGSTRSERVIKDASLAKASHSERYLAAIPYPGIIFDAKLRAVHDGMARNFEGHAPAAYLWKLREAGLSFFSNSPDYLIVHAYNALKLGRWQDAILHAEKVLTLTKNKTWLIEAQQLLGVIYFDNKDMALARQCFIESIKLKPNPTAHYHLGLIAGEQGKLDDAGKHLQLSINLARDAKKHFPEPWNAFYKLLLHQKKNTEAKQLRALGIKEKIWGSDK